MCKVQQPAALVTCALGQGDLEPGQVRANHLTLFHIWTVSSPPRLCCLRRSSALLFCQSPETQNQETFHTCGIITFSRVRSLYCSYTDIYTSKLQNNTKHRFGDVL